LCATLIYKIGIQHPATIIGGEIPPWQGFSSEQEGRQADGARDAALRWRPPHHGGGLRHAFFVRMVAPRLHFFCAPPCCSVVDDGGIFIPLILAGLDL